MTVVTRGATIDHVILGALAAVGTLLVSAAGVSGQMSCDDDRGDRDRDRFCEIREQTMGPTGSLEVDAGANGGITVEGWDRDEIRVRAKVWATSDEMARAEALTEQVEVRIDGDLIEADGPDTRNRENWGVSFELMVPRDTDLDLDANNGGISIAYVNGETRFRTTNGGVHLEAMAGDVEGRTVNGGLHVALSGYEWNGRGLDAQTTNGGITLTIPDDYSADLETGTVNGGIEIDFPVTVQGRIGRKIEATLGDGGAPVRVVTTNGGVRIRKGSSAVEVR